APTDADLVESGDQSRAGLGLGDQLDAVGALDATDRLPHRGHARSVQVEGPTVEDRFVAQVEVAEAALGVEGGVDLAGGEERRLPAVVPAVLDELVDRQR